MKREFGVSSYKAIKREYHQIALGIIDRYECPVIMKENINMINNQQYMELNGELTRAS